MLYSNVIGSNMKDKILEIIANNPKHYVKMIKRNVELNNWVIEHSKVHSDNVALCIYSAINNVSNVCQYGKEKKFGGLSVGLRNCGTAKNCQCTREQVAESVKQTKQSITDENKQLINKKREATNLQKYGVANIGQTNFAKLAHTQFYLNSCSKKQIEQKTAKQVGYEKFSQYVEDRYKFKLLTNIDDYHGIRQKDAHEYVFECINCHTQVSKKFYHRVGINCEKCNPYKASYLSNEEQEVFDYIKNELGIENGVQSDKKIIAPYELDMVFHEQKIAIEYCGLYWHSELSSLKHKNYHRAKMELVNNAGYRLITIFSDEWLSKNEIVKSRLRHIFGISSEREQARKLKVVEVSNKEAKEFLEKYHIQGFAIAPIRLGLVNKNEKLIALMTFAAGRKSLNSNDQYELVRFASCGSVVGGAGKLLKHFVEKYKPTKLITYADLRWSNGNLYERLGFNKIGDAKVGYWYVKNYIKREHRYNYTKHRLVKMGNDSSISEWSIMKSLGYDRVWDCGHQKFELIFSPSNNL